MTNLQDRRSTDIVIAQVLSCRPCPDCTVQDGPAQLQQGGGRQRREGQAGAGRYSGRHC